MKLSKRGEYALRALIDLGLAAALGRPRLSLSELARREQMPTKFLEQIIGQLRAAGLVTAARGPRGGYTMGRPAEQPNAPANWLIFWTTPSTRNSPGE